MSRALRFAAAVIGVFISIVLIVGCGDAPILELIDVQPKVAASSVGGALVQFGATGHYSGGATSSMIGGLTWTSSDASIATITPDGLAKCIANTGPVTITAAAPGSGGTVSDTATLTCGP